ncbi:hypothetical protein VE01_09199 [Pseudogymnoascus verrucosus]|uniref:Autophagy-related protein 14 n=1 Tax=Pseudogymnoascus verrucosus TaxID=342668 RepID=A0A1B8GBF0_9PEZI|nr:uncharacterized protein VE01_09199 [Pseudogymnoascus verrucosus]OBT93179.1 hypothetical protein VE01_09199 [Pseudogymnoascus verrucosus]
MDGKIHCDICFRPGSRKLPFLCATDARNQLYESRLRHAEVLLQNDALSQKIAALTTEDPSSSSPSEGKEHTYNPPSTEPPTDDRTPEQLALALSVTLSERDASAARTAEIILKADTLRLSLTHARASIAARKAALAARQRALEKARNGLAARQQRALDDLAKASKMSTYRWNHAHALTVQARAFLCYQAAELYGLQRVRVRGGAGADEYTIGGVRIVDLRYMNNASATLISTSLGHVANLLVLVSRYLSVRLPAEITLPHADYPLPTIFSVASSYTDKPVPFPGTPAQTPSPSASRLLTAHGRSRTPPPLDRNMPRPRPLFVKTPLPRLAKEDPGAYTTFVEATALLAYDVAWLCKSQGIELGSGAVSKEKGVPFEDMTAIGKNLYNLLIGGRAPPAAPSAAGVPTVASGDSGSEGLGLGRYSHGARHSNLVGKGGEELVRGFRLLGPVKMADRLRRDLLAEVVGAGWEMVEGEVDEEQADKGGKGDKGGNEGERGAGGSTSNVGSSRDGEGEGEGEARGPGLLGESFASLERSPEASTRTDAKRGSNGWMKLKPRPST